MNPTTPCAAQAFGTLRAAHRSIRQFKPDPLPAGLVDRVLAQALHGSASSGNLNRISVVKTQDATRRERLCHLHVDHPMVRQAPLAQHHTRRIKHAPDRFAAFSADIEALLAERGWRRRPGA